MKNKISKTIKIPEGITCEYTKKNLTCKKSSLELSKKLFSPDIAIEVKDNEIFLGCNKGNKIHYKKIMTFLARIKNIFKGLTEEYVYNLESCNVHFPMTLKVEAGKLAINNFLGEKVPRYAKILPSVKVMISGQQITISSSDKEAAGQTAANFEKATIIKNLDRRVYQDGIYIVQKPRRQI